MIEILKLARKHRKNLIISTLVDIIFIAVMLILFYVFYTSSIPALVEISNIAQSEMGVAVQALSAEDSAAIEALMPKIGFYYNFLIKNTVLMLFSFLLIAIITQSISFYKLHKLKIKFWTYAKSFAIIGSSYFLIFLILAPLFSGFYYFLQRAAGTPGRQSLAPLMVIFLLILYLAITTFSLIGKKNIVKQSFEKAFSKYFLRFAASVAGIFIIAFIIFKIATFLTSPFIQVLLGLLIFPFVTIAKLWMLE